MLSGSSPSPEFYFEPSHEMNGTVGMTALAAAFAAFSILTIEDARKNDSATVEPVRQPV